MQRKFDEISFALCVASATAFIMYGGPHFKPLSIPLIFVAALYFGLVVRGRDAG